ncbi:MAG: EthD family reductase [Anaerolineales bacterium]
MHKLIVLFKSTNDPTQLETQWSGRFVPLAERMPGIRRVTVTRVLGGASEASEFHMIHEFYFDDLPALQRAMASEEGQKAGQALMSFAENSATILLAEHLEEAR